MNLIEWKQKDPRLLGRQLHSVMTQNPRTLSPDSLVSEIARLFRKYQLDNFPVLDVTGKPVGILDEKDLLNEGLAL
jgi:arabinose-5-phosphate isomerase